MITSSDNAPLKTVERSVTVYPLMKGCHLYVIDIVHFIKYYELNVPDEIGSFVKHATKDLSCHNQTARFWIDLNIAGKNTDGRSAKGLFKIAQFLIG